MHCVVLDEEMAAVVAKHRPVHYVGKRYDFEATCNTALVALSMAELANLAHAARLADAIS